MLNLIFFKTNFGGGYNYHMQSPDNMSIDSFVSDTRIEQGSIASSCITTNTSSNFTYIAASEIRRRLEIESSRAACGGSVLSGSVSGIRDPEGTFCHLI